MNNLEIERILHKMPEFVGVFPSDVVLPRRIPGAYIINYDTSQGLGTHWVSIYMDTNEIAYYFDPYGFPPLIDSIKNNLDRLSKVWIYNDVCYQDLSPSSYACGHYCIAFLIFKHLGFSHSFIKKFFSEKIPALNDTKAIDLIDLFNKVV